ncbi:MAG: shikimate kinase [Ruminococcus sp.]|nr:shikimate kinase [Ruminococcus sp.]
MENFILIGMPGSGKSTVGQILAENIGYHFMDTDDLIIERYQKPLMNLIEEMGVEGFIQAEGAILETVEASHTVIATGGSVIYSEKGMAHLQSLGKVIYLCYTEEDIAARVGDLTTRGVVCRNCRSFRELFEERRPYYEKYADIVVHLEHATFNHSTQRVLKAVEQYVHK